MLFLAAPSAMARAVVWERRERAAVDMVLVFYEECIFVGLASTSI